MEPPEEATAFKPGAASFERERERRLASRGLLYDERLEDYVTRFVDGDALQERLDKRDEALHDVSMRGVSQTKL